MFDHFVADAFGNLATELNGLQAAAIVADTSIPMLTSFTLNLDNNASVMLTFSKVVEVQNFMVGGYTLRSARTSDAVSLNLGMSRLLTTADSDVMEIVLLSDDLFPIQLDLDFGIIHSSASCREQPWIKLHCMANSLDLIPTTAALQAERIIPDETRPLLVSFTLDLGTGTLALTFSEVVNASSFDLELFVFQNAAFSPSESTTFTNTSSVQGGNSNTKTRFK